MGNAVPLPIEIHSQQKGTRTDGIPPDVLGYYSTRYLFEFKSIAYMFTPLFRKKEITLMTTFDFFNPLPEKMINPNNPKMKKAM